jgi:hypothetical protein
MTRRAPARPKSRADASRRETAATPESGAHGAAVSTADASDPGLLGPLRPESETRLAFTPRVSRPQAARRRLALAVVAFLCAIGAAAGVGKALSERRLGGLGPVRAHAERAPSAAAAAAAAAAPEAKPILADYRPPDRDQVRKAYLNVSGVYRAEGLSGVVRQTMDCFDALKQTPSYQMLDYCLALDAFAEAMARKLALGQPAAADGYFTTTQPRELAAARGVVGADGDAGARVLDVRRLAGEVSRDGPAAARAAIASVSGASATTAAVETAPSAGPGRRTAPLRPALAAVTVAHAAPPAKATPAKVAAIRVAAVKPAPRDRHAAPHAKLERASVSGDHRAKPAVVKASIHAPAKTAHHKPVRVAAKSEPKREPPHLFRAAARVAASFAHAVKTSLHPAKPTPTVAERRTSEPAEWVDCRHPRSASEVRLCEDIDSSGDGTLQGQLSRSRYEPSTRP